MRGCGVHSLWGFRCMQPAELMMATVFVLEFACFCCLLFCFFLIWLVGRGPRKRRSGHLGSRIGAGLAGFFKFSFA